MRDKLRITKIFGDENGNDTRCKLCGSLLYSVVRDGAFVHVALGTPVDDPTIRPSKHIFVGSKARCFRITDDRRSILEAASRIKDLRLFGLILVSGINLEFCRLLQ